MESASPERAYNVYFLLLESSWWYIFLILISFYIESYSCNQSWQVHTIHTWWFGLRFQFFHVSAVLVYCFMEIKFRKMEQTCVSMTGNSIPLDPVLSHVFLSQSEILSLSLHPVFISSEKAIVFLIIWLNSVVLDRNMKNSTYNWYIWNRLDMGNIEEVGWAVVRSSMSHTSVWFLC